MKLRSISTAELSNSQKLHPIFILKKNKGDFKMIIANNIFIWFIVLLVATFAFVGYGMSRIISELEVIEELIVRKELEVVVKQLQEDSANEQSDIS